MTFRTTGADPKFTSNSTFIGSEEFIRKYPEITQRVVKTVLIAARWLAEQESKPEPVCGRAPASLGLPRDESGQDDPPNAEGAPAVSARAPWVRRPRAP